MTASCSNDARDWELLAPRVVDVAECFIIVRSRLCLMNDGNFDTEYGLRVRLKAPRNLLLSL